MVHRPTSLTTNRLGRADARNIPATITRRRGRLNVVFAVATRTGERPAKIPVGRCRRHSLRVCAQPGRYSTGRFRIPGQWGRVRAIWVSAIFTAVPLAAEFVVFLRRDVSGE